MITPEQLAQRRNYLGSSDTAALFQDVSGNSLDKYNNAKDIFYSKVYGMEKKFDKAQMKEGRRQEPLILAFASEHLNEPIETNPDLLWHKSEKYPWLACNLDGYLKNLPCIVEAKLGFEPKEWGEPGTDEVPDRVIFQAHHQMVVLDWEVCFVPVFIISFGIREVMYRVNRDKDIADIVIDTTHDFWYNNVLKGIEPDISQLPRLDVMKAIERVPESVVDMSADLVTKWEDDKAQRKVY